MKVVINEREQIGLRDTERDNWKDDGLDTDEILRPLKSYAQTNLNQLVWVLVKV